MIILLLLPLFFYSLYVYLTKMFLTLVGICMVIYFLFYLICFVMFDCDVTLGFCEKFGKPVSSLKGKVVFITGASSGIGEHTAIALAKNGVKLVLAARRRDELERVKSECLAKSQGRLSPNDVFVLPMDVLKVDHHQQWFDEALQHFGQIDVLVNNAGRSQRATWENIDLRVDREMFDLNVFAVVSLSRIAVKYFQEKNEGHIVVTSSAAGIVGVPLSATYTGTKHAIHGYFNSLRNEKMINNIAVTLLCPGPIFTNFLSQCFTETIGETYGHDVSSTDKRMTGERCGYLCAVAIANRLNESWMARLPVIPLIYIVVYSPTIYNLLLKFVGPQKMYKLRDSKDAMEKPKTSVNPI